MGKGCVVHYHALYYNTMNLQIIESHNTVKAFSSKPTPEYNLFTMAFYHGVRKVYHGVRKVYHGVRKVYHGIRKVYHGVRKVNHEARKVQSSTLQKLKESIFKGQSNIRILATVTTNQPTKQPRKYKAFQILQSKG